MIKNIYIYIERDLDIHYKTLQDNSLTLKIKYTYAFNGSILLPGGDLE